METPPFIKEVLMTTGYLLANESAKLSGLSTIDLNNGNVFKSEFKLFFII